MNHVCCNILVHAVNSPHLFVAYIYNVGLHNINSFVLFFPKSFYRTGSFPVNVKRAFTTLLSFYLTGFMLEQTLVATSDVPRLSLSSYLNPAMVHFPFGLPLLFQWWQFVWNSNVAVTQNSSITLG